MSEGRESRAGPVRARENIIKHEQERLHTAMSEYVQISNSINREDAERVAPAELHNAVIRYYWALKPLASEPAVSDFWDSATLWRNREGEEACGFDTLMDYANKYRTVERQVNDFKGHRVVREKEPVRLPPEHLLNIGTLLNKAAWRLGFAPNADGPDTDGDAGFDYSDILEEGPPGGDAPQLDGNGSDNGGGSAE